MKRRVFTQDEYWKILAQTHVPELSFKSSGLDFDTWHEKAMSKLMELLGPFPEKVDVEPEVQFSIDQGSYIRQRVILKADKIMSIPAVVLIPKTASEANKVPAILCSHGHGPFGKNSVVGWVGTSANRADVADSNYNYGEQMAEHGFVTISPDLRGFGERRDPVSEGDHRDRCNVNYLKGSLLGIYPLTLNISDMMRCIDYLQQMDCVDPDRIGMMGLSYGGTMTTFTTAVEPRIKAADIISYVNPFDGFGLEDGNFCGSQVVPEIYKYFDTYDIAGLIARRPLLMEMGIYDRCFPYERLHKGFEETKVIYEAAGVGQKLYEDDHPEGHAFSGRKAFDFFAEYL